MSLMILGTASDVGKSTAAAAVCRILYRRGIKSAPFKSQNMSLNSYITKNGKEIGIAQAVQAFASGIEPDERNNPILIKPKGGSSSQIICKGVPYKDLKTGEYYNRTSEFLKIASASYRSLESEYTNIVVEGAGGAAELNLYKCDIANILLAEELQIPIIIVGDIERGGIFAQLIGTYELLPENIRKNVCGFIINKFRGDVSLFTDGIRIIEEKTGVKVLGILPYEEFRLPSEDSLAISGKSACHTVMPVKIAIVNIPQISNFSDFEILEKYASVKYTDVSDNLSGYDCVILPGTKNTIEALKILKNAGFGDKLDDLRRRRIPVIAICGSYQILGRKIIDNAVESDEVAEYEGFGVFNTVTRFDEYTKTTIQVRRLSSGIPPFFSKGAYLNGYEIHMGMTERLSGGSAFISGSDGSEPEGCIADDGLTVGTYMHGIFENPEFTFVFMKYLYEKKGLEFSMESVKSERYDDALEKLAVTFEKYTDVDEILKHFDTNKNIEK